MEEYLRGIEAGVRFVNAYNIGFLSGFLAACLCAWALYSFAEWLCKKVGSYFIKLWRFALRL
jgi:hypothetical protein